MTLIMHPSLLEEIPDFIIDSIVYCDCLTFKKNDKSCFILAKNLKFYEFRKKQLQHSLNLNETCLSSIQTQIENYKRDEDFTNDSVSREAKIKIGKYIYRNFEISKLYLLLHCWDKLIIIEHKRNETNVMQIRAEYEKVLTFKIVPHTLIKYQAEVNIQFDDGFSCTDFQENDSNAVDANTSGNDKVTQKNEFKHILERVRTTKAELQLHKEITQKQFESLRNTQNFGNNFVRSTKLEEKFMLSKCGDLWMRVTATDELVLGLPLVNNCGPPNLTILKRLQPIININEESAITTYSHLHFEHRLYRLRETFENLETLEMLFQSQDAHFEGETIWQKEAKNELLPNSFAVMLLKLKLSQLIFMNAPCQLFVRFEVEKDLETLTPKIETFEQHLFIKTLDFQQVLQHRSTHEICFQEQTLHQDLLALAMVSHDTKLRIEFVAQKDFEKFEHLLASKFDFELVRRKVDSHTSASASATSTDFDEQCDDLDISFTGTLFYNRKPNSLWFGSLAIRQAVTNLNILDDDEPVLSDWIFYNKNEENSFLMIKLLFDELISLKCNINSVKYAKHQDDVSSKLISFENAIREELNAFSELYKTENDPKKFKEKFKTLAEYQFKTDVIANEL